MARRCRRRVVRGFGMIVVSAGVLFSSCTALIDIPPGSIDISDNGVFVDFPGTTIRVSDDGVLVDIPGIDIDVNGDVHLGS